MAITILSTVFVPDSIIAKGISGKQIRKNSRASAQGGQMQINVIWSNTLRQYDIGLIPRTKDQWLAIEALFEVTEAGAYGMLLKDPKNCSASDSTGRVTLINAGAHTYQLVYRYTDAVSTLTKDRTIRFTLASDFILKISGTPTGSYTLNATTGVITIPSDPAVGNVTWSGTFYTPVHFRDDEIDWELRAGGSEGARLLTGPSVILDEVKQ